MSVAFRFPLGGPNGTRPDKWLMLPWVMMALFLIPDHQVWTVFRPRPSRASVLTGLAGHGRHDSPR